MKPLKKSKIKRAWLFLKKQWLKGVSIFVLFIITSTLIFRIVPLPFSAYMLQQKIGSLFTGKDYSIHYDWVSLDNIAWQVQLAVIASEDQLFPAHYGFDWNAISQAFSRNQKGKKVRGASTITQQTAKNLYLWHGQSWLRKGLEVPFTLMLELLWNKKRILEVYLNIAEFGEGIFGVEAASQYYFAKPAKQLSQAESALLAAILPNPIRYGKSLAKPYVKKRQGWIIRQMNQIGEKAYLQQVY